MSTERRFLFAIITNIYLTILFTLISNEVVVLSPMVQKGLWTLSCLTYISSLYYLVWVGKKYEDNMKMVNYLTVLILFTFVYDLIDIIYGFENLNEWTTLLVLPMFILAFMFSFQALKVKSPEISSEFKVIGIVFILNPIFQIIFPLAIAFTQAFEYVHWKDIFNFPIILSIAYVAIGRARNGNV